MWILIFGDMLIFSILFVTFASYRRENLPVFLESQTTLDQSLGLLMTVLLLTSSWAVVLAVKNSRSGDPNASRQALAGILLGLAFIGVKVIEYGQKLSAGISPATNDFFMLYFALTGIHLIHVIIGLGALMFLKSRIMAGINTADDAIVDGCAILWHMVDLLWVVLFAIFYVHK